MTGKRQPCIVPDCPNTGVGVVCRKCFYDLPSWLTYSRGRNRAQMASEILAFLGARRERRTG